MRYSLQETGKKSKNNYMSNEIFFGLEAMNKMKEGIDVGGNAVKVTLGAFGRTVFIYNKDTQHLEATKDGVTVITSMRLKNQVQDAGLKQIQEVANKTAHEVGDATTSASVLFQEIVSQGIKLKQSGINPTDLRRGMEKASKSITETICRFKKDIGNNKKILRQVASVSANGDSEIGDLIGGIYEKLGKHAAIEVIDGQSPETTVELVNGFQFLGGYLSEYFINTPNNTSELINPYILIIDGKVEDLQKINPILEKVIQENRSLVILADDFAPNVSASVLRNVKEAKRKWGLIKHQFSGTTKDELLLDLCAYTGATLITEKTGKKIENIDTSFLGECEQIISKKEETTIYNGKSNKKEVALRIEDANQKIKTATNSFVKEKYELRLAKLSGSVAMYYVGGNSKVEVSEKMARIDDSIRATRCAVTDGVVVGGGAMLLKCIADIEKLKWDNEDEKSGIKLIQKSIEKPFWQICDNAGKNGSLLAEKVKEKGGNYGYNCKTDKIEDMFKAGIIDPAKVVTKCAENAISAAIQFLISECVIVNEIVNS